MYHKRLDMAKLGNTSENIADKFPGDVLVTHKVAETNQVYLLGALGHENISA